MRRMVITVLVASIVLPAVALAAVPIGAAAGGVAGASALGTAFLVVGATGITGLAIYGFSSGRLNGADAARSIGVGTTQPLLCALDGQNVAGWEVASPWVNGEGSWLLSAQKGNQVYAWDTGIASNSRSLPHFQNKVITQEGEAVSGAFDHWPFLRFARGSEGSATVRALGEAAEDSAIRAGARTLGKIAIPIAIIADGYFIYQAYNDDGGKFGINTAGAVGASAGGWTGAIVGAVIGQALIPIPVVGAIIGAAAGAFLGSMIGQSVAQSAYTSYTNSTATVSPKPITGGYCSVNGSYFSPPSLQLQGSGSGGYCSASGAYVTPVASGPSSSSFLSTALGSGSGSGGYCSINGNYVSSSGSSSSSSGSSSSGHSSSSGGSSSSHSSGGSSGSSCSSGGSGSSSSSGSGSSGSSGGYCGSSTSSSGTSGGYCGSSSGSSGSSSSSSGSSGGTCSAGNSTSSGGSSSSGSSSSGGCFITTAMCGELGLPDDCEELTTLRSFRDSFMLATPEKQAMVKQYYAQAPAVVAALDARADKSAIYTELRQRFILPAVLAIQVGWNDVAMKLYMDGVAFAQAAC